MDKEWKKCPKCKLDLTTKNRKFSILDGIAIGCFAELSVWLFMIMLLIFFSMLEGPVAYGIAIFLAAFFLFYLTTFIGNYSCMNCNKQYSYQELKKEYNKSLKNETPQSGAS